MFKLYIFAFSLWDCVHVDFGEKKHLPFLYLLKELWEEGGGHLDLHQVPYKCDECSNAKMEGEGERWGAMKASRILTTIESMSIGWIGERAISSEVDEELREGNGLRLM